VGTIILSQKKQYTYVYFKHSMYCCENNLLLTHVNDYFKTWAFHSMTVLQLLNICLNSFIPRALRYRQIYLGCH